MMSPRDCVLGFCLTAVTTSVLYAQTPTRVEVTPGSLSMEVGDSAQLSARVFDESGGVMDVPVMFFASNARRRLAVARTDGLVQALKGGDYAVTVFVLTDRSVSAEVTVSVAFPPVTGVTLSPTSERFFMSASVRHEALVTDAAGDIRRDVPVRWSTDDAAIASVSRFGVLTAHSTGSVTLSATAEGVTTTHQYDVVDNPIRTLSISLSQDSIRTGDVIHATAVALDARGQRVVDAPITFVVVANPADSVVAQQPSAEVDQRGRFVAQDAGDYTIMAIAPGHMAQQTVTATNRFVSQEIEFIGQAAVRDVSTSDLWIWEGVDGRDYAVTGTHRGQGAAYFWDVTDASSPLLVDSVVVDARTVNDVKISEDGRIAVISREGASNRRNGLVILDVTNPHDVQTLAAYDDGLTGGVHNVFVYQDHVYAINNGRRFDVINIEDPTNPRRVGRFELDTPGHGVHDIWIVDGIAYTSNWGDGVVLIDVGNGIMGGSPSNPVEIARYADFGGATHAAFPYRSPTGKFYVIMGDERGRPGFDGQDQARVPGLMAGYMHFVDFTDPLNPEEVARYEVPEAGSHNIWIEDDKLYAAFYNGGLRVVDIAGELKGNLYNQGREIARYLAYDPEGVTSNAPQTWGAQPYKGNLFFAEYYSGLWTVRLMPRDRVLTP